MLDRASFDFVAHILNGPTGRRWYADGEPTWKQGRHGKPAKTSKQARKERRQLVKVLRRHGKGNDSALRLADILESCSKKHRCLSGACPVCSRAFQRWFVSAASSVVSRKKHWYVVSFVWREHRFAEGNLDPNTMFQRLRSHLRVSLKVAGIRQAIGGFDISMNEHQDGKFVPHWRPHAWILDLNEEPKEIAEPSQDEISSEQKGQTTIENCPLRRFADSTGLRIERPTSCVVYLSHEKGKATRLRLDATRAIDPYAPRRSWNSRLLFIELALRIGCSSSAGPQFSIMTMLNPYPLTIGIILIDCRIPSTSQTQFNSTTLLSATFWRNSTMMRK